MYKIHTKSLRLKVFLLYSQQRPTLKALKAFVKDCGQIWTKQVTGRRWRTSTTHKESLVYHSFLFFSFFFFLLFVYFLFSYSHWRRWRRLDLETVGRSMSGKSPSSISQQSFKGSWNLLHLEGGIDAAAWCWNVSSRTLCCLAVLFCFFSRSNSALPFFISQSRVCVYMSSGYTCTYIRWDRTRNGDFK